MSQPSIKEIQTKIKRHIDELEEKIKNSKVYWNCGEDVVDTNFVQNFIDGHYSEIVHHLNEIRHHLEQINHHKQQIEQIQSSAPKTGEETVVKRPEDDKLRVRNWRASRSASLKYVLQWEKMMDEQKYENPLAAVRKRSKERTNFEDGDVPKIMVKNRVQQFEGIQKPRRISSTVEAFLDCNLDKPRRTNSYSVLDDIADEDDEVEETASECGGNERVSFGSCGNLDCIEIQGDGEIQGETNESEPVGLDRNENVKSEGDGKMANGSGGNEEERLEVVEEVTNDRPKPRIVEIHYKQPSPVDVSNFVPLL